MNKATRVTLIAVIIAFALPALAADAATEALYKTKCAACHGPDGAANTPAGKKLETRSFMLPEIMKSPDKELIEVTSKGKNKMPAFDKKLTDEQIKSLVGYVRELQKPKK
jgi:cytochrome c6